MSRTIGTLHFRLKLDYTQPLARRVALSREVISELVQTFAPPSHLVFNPYDLYGYTALECFYRKRSCYSFDVEEDVNNDYFLEFKKLYQASDLKFPAIDSTVTAGSLVRVKR